MSQLNALDKITGEAYKTEIEEILNTYKFYTILRKIGEDKEGNKVETILGVKFDRLKILERLKDIGYFAYEQNDVIHLLKVNDNKAEITNDDKISVHIGQLIRTAPAMLPDGVTQRMLFEKFLENDEKLFKKTLFRHLKPDKEIEFYQDTIATAHFFYNNCIVKVSADKVETFNYSDKTKVVWKSQIHDRDFTPVTNFEKCNWAKFMANIAGKDSQQRINAFKSITGYLLHKYFDDKLKGIYITDGRISDYADGRSGKTLWIRGIGRMLNRSFKDDKVFVEISGKSFDVTKNSKYESCSLNTSLIHINDIINRGKDALKIDRLFNDISDGVQIRQLYKSPFTIMSKFVLSGNKSIELNGGSDKDRIVQIELADHYSVDHSPETEFKQWFFRDWDEKEFNQFDNFMLHCVQYYLKNGLQKPESILLDEIKLHNETCAEFVYFMEDLHVLELVGKRISKKQLFDKFIKQYPDHGAWLKTNRFTLWVRKYCDYTPELLSYSDFKGDRKAKFEPRNQNCDICLEDKTGYTLPTGDCFVFHLNTIKP